MQQRKECGTRSLSYEEKIEQKAAMEAWKEANSYFPYQDSVNVDVYWHQVLRSDGSGGISDCQIMDSINVLNGDFSGSAFTFTLQEITTSTNDDWYEHQFNTDEELAMKANRQGNEATLNIWSCVPFTDEGDPLLGYATLPTSYENFPEYDGVVILQQTVPCGSECNFNMGKTLTHEVTKLRPTMALPK